MLDALSQYRQKTPSLATVHIPIDSSEYREKHNKMARKLIAVVTGSNRGIGSAIAHQLATTHHASPLVVYATSRKGESLDITPSHDNEIRYEMLDISDKQSILNFVRKAVKEDPQSRAIDILINNAGVNLNPEPSITNITHTINTNYGGTKTVCEYFLQHGNMASNPGARIVNVSSVASEQVSQYSSELQAKFHAPDLTLDGIDQLADDYVQAAASNTLSRSGWDHADSYSVSKVCVNAMTQVLARQNPKLLINCCCPGWVDTDMGNQIGKPAKTLDDGARIPVRLAVGDVQGQTGKYWSNPSIGGTGDGRVLEW